MSSDSSCDSYSETGEQGPGWNDSETGQRVQDHQIKERYEKTILAHTGIRMVEPELFNGYDPHRKRMMRQVPLSSFYLESPIALDCNTHIHHHSWGSVMSSWPYRMT